MAPCAHTTPAPPLRPSPSGAGPQGLPPSWRFLQPHKRNLQVSGRAQEVHDLHHFAIRYCLVRTQENACVLVTLCRRLERARQEIAAHRIVAERQREVGLNGKIEWPIRT